MTARELIRIQSTRFGLGVVFWIASLAISVILFTLADIESYTWIPVVVCLIGLFVTSHILNPKCPFCNQTALVGRGDDLGNFCKHCGCSLDEIVTEQNRFRQREPSNPSKQNQPMEKKEKARS